MSMFPHKKEGRKEGIHEQEMTHPAHPLYKTLNEL